MTKGRTSTARLATADRDLRALELRRSGATLDTIASSLGFASAGGAWKSVERALRRAFREPAEALITLESDRLDALLGACWPKAMAGDMAAIDRALRISERRCRLLGLDNVVPGIHVELQNNHAVYRLEVVFVEASTP